jgi:branched-chain amino acid transport system substrate-binding protein
LEKGGEIREPITGSTERTSHQDRSPYPTRIRRKIMKPRIWSVITLFVIVSLTPFASGCQRATDQTFKIGAIFPLTGPAAESGIGERKGLEMAIEEINAAGGIRGQQVELIVYDSKTSGDEAKLAGEKLVFQDKVPVIMTTISAECLAIIDLVEENEVVHITTSRTPSVTDDPKYTYTFRWAPTNSTLFPYLAEDLVRLGASKIAILDESSPYGTTAAAAMTEFGQKEGLEIVYDTKYDSTATDFSSYITAIKGSGADTIFHAGYTADTIAIISEYRAQGLDEAGIRFVGDDQTGFPAVREAVDHEGIYTQWIYLKDLNEEAAAFHEKYVEKYNEDTDVVRAYGYSFGYVIKEAAELAETTTDGEAIRDAMYKVRFDSVFGGDSHFDELGQVIWPRPVLVMTQNGELVRVWQD